MEKRMLEMNAVVAHLMDLFTLKLTGLKFLTKFN